METIFRKVSVNRLPNVSGFYFAYYSGIGSWLEFNSEDKKWIEGDENNLKDYNVTKYVTHWLEMVELPNDEQIKDCGRQWKEALRINPTRIYADKDFMSGATWIRNFVLAVTPINTKTNDC